MPRLCGQCKKEYSVKKKMMSVFASRENPIICSSCGHKAVIEYSFQFYIILILAIGGAGLVSFQSCILFSVLGLLVTVILFFALIYVAPTQSIESQEKIIEKETSFGSISLFRIFSIVMGSVYALLVLVVDSNIVSALLMLFAAYSISDKQSRPVVGISVAFMSILALYII